MTYTITIPEWAVFWFLALLTMMVLIVILMALLPPPPRVFDLHDIGNINRKIDEIVERDV